MTERNFRDVVQIAMQQWLDDRRPISEWTIERANGWEEEAGELAGYIMAELRRMGLAIHKESSCIRLPAPAGRAMTTEELILVGLDPVGGD